MKTAEELRAMANAMKTAEELKAIATDTPLNTKEQENCDEIIKDVLIKRMEVWAENGCLSFDCYIYEDITEREKRYIIKKLESLNYTAEFIDPSTIKLDWS
jgi:hypothetical protein